MPSRFAKAKFLLGLGVVVTGVGACSNDEVTEPPRGPSDLRITRVDTLATYPADPTAPTESTTAVDCEEALLVSVEPYDDVVGKLGNFTLKPPGGCSDTNCGWMVLSVYHSAQVDGVGIFCATFDSIQSPVLVDLPARCRLGNLRFHLELADYEAMPVMKDDQNRLAYDYPFPVSVSREDCGTSSTTGDAAASR